MLDHYLVLGRRTRGCGDDLFHLSGEHINALDLEHIVGAAYQRVDAGVFHAASAVARNDAGKVVRAVADKGSAFLA